MGCKQQNLPMCKLVVRVNNISLQVVYMGAIMCHNIQDIQSFLQNVQYKVFFCSLKFYNVVTIHQPFQLIVKLS